jgi:hypothetical protein
MAVQKEGKSQRRPGAAEEIGEVVMLLSSSMRAASAPLRFSANMAARFQPPLRRPCSDSVSRARGLLAMK